MSISTYNERDEQLIVKNVIASCKDVTKLSAKAYTFLMLCSGFIAHYNQAGFIDFYSDGALKRDILKFQRFNQ